MDAMPCLSPIRPRAPRWLIVLIESLALIATAAAQSAAPASQSQPPTTSDNSDTSIAGAARDTKAQKATHAKKVFTDEDMESSAGPLPRLKMDGAENADEVVAAITTYKSTHSAAQTEQAIRIWYERYDEMLAAAIQENSDMTMLRNANSSNGYDLCQEGGDYQQCRYRQMAEQRGARNDQVKMMKNNQLEVRIQHAFGKVRGGLMQNNLHYDWFKIRTTNGIDVF